jgi:hypothetical protein
MVRKLIGLIAGLAVLGAVVGGSGSKSTTSTTAGATSNASSDTSSPKASTPAACASRASEKCTPSVGPSRSVRVDALRWRVVDVRTASTIGDMTYGGGAKADGVFVIAKVTAHSLKGESATLTSDVVKLQVGNRQYSESNDGATAAIMDAAAGEAQPFLLKDIGPGLTVKGLVVFDVPPSALGKTPRLRFNELGFGRTHGFIQLPAI